MDVMMAVENDRNFVERVSGRVAPLEPRFPAVDFAPRCRDENGKVDVGQTRQSLALRLVGGADECFREDRDSHRQPMSGALSEE
jgi:hypothetical protein